LLQLALQSLQSQTFPADLFEVLVIDNGSTDNTKQVAELFQQQVGNIRYFFDPTPGLHVGRHLGMKMAKSDILVYADDDIEAFSTWIEGVAEAFFDEKVVLVGGKNLPKFETEAPKWISKMWETNRQGFKSIGALSILDLGDNVKEISPLLVYGCNYSIRKSVLIEAGGFHPDGMPQQLIRYRGDGETHVSMYIQNKGYKTIYAPKATIYHLVPSKRMTEDYFCLRAFNQGVSDSYTNTRSQLSTSKINITKMIRSLFKSIFYEITRNKFRHKIMKAYDNGYKYHQNELKKDETLLKYVMKEDYYNGLEDGMNKGKVQ
jgi:glycosyltransferase involved in cell wall biosynthesis